MKYTHLFKMGGITLLVISSIFVSFLYFIRINPSKSLENISPEKTVNFGVVDSRGQYDNDPKITVENRFVAWKKDDISEIKKHFNEVNKKNRTLILTVEPWGFNSEARDELLPTIIKGGYASTIISICKEIDLQPKPVYLRWGHEMDLYPTSRYNWAQPDPQVYITAFQYVTTLCRKQTKNVRMLWSPGGKVGFTAFYPGDQYVDAIGFSIFSFEDFELKNSKRNYNFIDLFDYRYNAVKYYRKDIVIAEMGVAGKPEYKAAWMDLALTRINNPQIQRYLKYVVYFNENDNIFWDPMLPKPDFSISSDLYPTLI